MNRPALNILGRPLIEDEVTKGCNGVQVIKLKGKYKCAHCGREIRLEELNDDNRNKT